ncbi:putative lysosomal cystine transporter [Rosa chinensis]|uniref:Putative lysosomal cystine transporter n=1 Tax=Rosa chinensis TaxID=74649 RepID=A0A2P6S627_ROSCH|nr:putative lysosomal cystine transporter [Rosa chinensis]
MFMIPVAANDVAFSVHAAFVTSIILLQIAIYEVTRKSESIQDCHWNRLWCVAICCSLVLGLPTHSWLWLISIFNSIQVFMTVIKYTPQV